MKSYVLVLLALASPAYISAELRHSKLRSSAATSHAGSLHADATVAKDVNQSAPHSFAAGEMHLQESGIPREYQYSEGKTLKGARQGQSPNDWQKEAFKKGYYEEDYSGNSPGAKMIPEPEPTRTKSMVWLWSVFVLFILMLLCLLCCCAVCFRSADPCGIEVVIEKAEGLRKLRDVRDSAPFVMCEVEGKKYSRFRTKSLEGRETIPAWKESWKIVGFKRTNQLKFTIADIGFVNVVDEHVDISEEHWIGVTTLSGSQCLQDKGYGPYPPLNLNAPNGKEGFGKLTVMVRSLFTLEVTIDSAQNLKAGPNRKIFVICEIYGDKGVDKFSRFQTPENNNRSNPAWKHEQKLFGVRQDDIIKFTVMQRGDITQPSPLGSCALTREQWRDPVFRKMKLEDSDPSATLRLRVKPVAAQSSELQRWKALAL